MTVEDELAELFCDGGPSAGTEARLAELVCDRLRAYGMSDHAIRVALITQESAASVVARHGPPTPWLPQRVDASCPASVPVALREPHAGDEV